MWIKVCANTCVEDALRAAELGADAVGFVFAPSARQVTPQQVRAITRALPAEVERIGVFGDAGVEEIAQAAETAGLTGVQLHGKFDVGLMEMLGERIPALAVIPVVHWAVTGIEAPDEEEPVRQAMRALDQVACAAPGRRVLVDAKVGRVSGGLGISFNWERAQGVFDAQREQGVRMVLAGGLRPENVAKAVQVLRPWGVDVASGVERVPGRKDFGKLREFLKNARGA